MINRKIFVFVLLFGTLTLFACGSSEKTEPTSAGISIVQLKEQGRFPIEVSLLYPAPPPAPAGQFQFTVKNISSSRLEILNGVVIFFDDEGRVIETLTQDLGTVDALPPAQEIKLQLTIGHREAAQGLWIPRRITYRAQDRSGRSFLMRWDNPGFADQLKDQIGDDHMRFLEENSEVQD